MEEHKQEESMKHLGEEEGEEESVSESVRDLPSDAVKELLSEGVCARCIFRLFGLQGRVYASSPSLSSVSSLSATTHQLCTLCFGILQFTYYSDDTQTLLQNQNLPLLIADTVKRHAYQFHTFSLEVSIPPIILSNDNSLRSYMKTKFGSQSWFQENLHTGCISTKDALKFSLIYPLENLLECKSSMGPFRIRLTYTHTKASKGDQNRSDSAETCKRRKIGESNVVAEIPVGNSLENDSSDGCEFLLEKANEPCHFTFYCYRTPFYFGGRYLKYSRNVSQTCWIIDDERMGEASVEEIIGGKILQACQGDSFKFHAAGREDIDVRMLGPGRPFLVEVQNARHIPSELFVKDVERKINNMENKLVRVKNLKLVGSEGWDLMREGEAEKQKQYAALVWISRPLKDEDFQCISSHKDLKVLQRTPIRVLHRRSPLEREKIIHWMKIEAIAGSSQYFLLHLCTQAGTYIKEFVHGDLGRTHPSIGSILGCRAEILQLDVTDIKMECFLT
ncbi:putative tRNA pseudouridine synthase Pus10 isoform X1 [Vigna unguiculata]|uniref:putative tRNA pseudouridine synthase Pus10 isoform X1 n=1 Tax=Vigna unguiculata TaxID=3917 RepID=UPI001016AD85|nr:putative tRNA pseudouridine synthase Pus10 isoform X1 [Vigna unguiculata]